jgi:hypothetical protein
MGIYIGPDQVMPVSSVLGTLIGLILLFWNKLILLFGRITGRPAPKREGGEPLPPASSPARAEETQHR